MEGEEGTDGEWGGLQEEEDEKEKGADGLATVLMDGAEESWKLNEEAEAEGALLRPGSKENAKDDAPKVGAGGLRRREKEKAVKEEEGAAASAKEIDSPVETEAVAAA